MIRDNKHMATTSNNSVNSFDWANDDDMFVSRYSNNKLENQRLVGKVIKELT